MSEPITGRLLRFGPAWDQPDADPIADCVAYAELGRAYVEDVTGADFEDAIADAVWQVVQTGETTVAGLTYTFDQPLDAGLWSVMAPESLVAHMVDWVDAYKQEQGWA